MILVYLNNKIYKSLLTNLGQKLYVLVYLNNKIYKSLLMNLGQKAS